MTKSSSGDFDFFVPRWQQKTLDTPVGLSTVQKVSPLKTNLSSTVERHPGKGPKKRKSEQLSPVENPCTKTK